MKKYPFKKICLFTLFALFCGVFFVGTNLKSNSLQAESAPATFSVTKYDVATSSDEGSVKLYTHTATTTDYYGVNPQTIANSAAGFINENNIVQAKFVAGENEIITSVSPILTINGVNSTAEAVQKGIFLDVTIDENSSQQFTITSLPKVGECYGKYVLNVNYLSKNKSTSETVQKNFSYSYYVLKQNAYFVGNSVNAQYENYVSVSNTLAYDRVVFYNYQEQTATETFKPLVSTINYTNINFQIVRTFQSITKTMNFSYNGSNLVVSGDNIAYYQTDGDYVKLIFNDLGTYVIKYNFIYTFNNQVDQINSFIGYAGRKTDKVDVFGYQLFYSDINNNSSKEFKNIDENGNVGTELTDISYLFPCSTSVSADSTSSNITKAINDKTLKIQQTNQAPVNFVTNNNCKILTQSNYQSAGYSAGDTDFYSKYWTITKESNIYKLSDNPTSFENEPIAQAGIYLVKVVYQFNDYLGNRSTKAFSQWFLFEITDSTPEIKIETKSEKEISDGQYTNENVIISKIESSQSIFNKPTKLVVYEQRNYTGSYTGGIEVQSNTSLEVSNNSRYRVVLYFGKGLESEYSSEFVIDKTPIENIQLFNAKTSTSSIYSIRGTTFDFITNQSAFVSWNEKDSGALTFAEYKYIPLERDYISNYNSDTLKQFYLNYAVPINYSFAYSGASNLITNQYTNQQSEQFITSTNLLSPSGLYIFKIYDSAGNEQFISFVVDTTSANILQQVKEGSSYGDYASISDLNITSEDTLVSWGQYKAIKFDNISKSNNVFDANDEWLKRVLNTNENFNTYLSTLSVNATASIYALTKINSQVLLEVNGVPTFIQGSTHNNFSYEIKFLGDDGYAIENQYNFYFRDEANTKVVDGYTNSSVFNYQNNYTAMHSLKISSDSSQTELFYYVNDKPAYLNQDSYTPAHSNDTKAKYYQPTTKKTLSASNEILKLMFNPTPLTGVIEVDTITYDYYAFAETTKDNDVTKTYTYAFNSNPTIDDQVIYDKNNSSASSSLTSSGNLLIWDVYLEYNSQTEQYQTKAGKYVITRTYDSTLDGYNEAVSNNHDFTTRTFTFIIDRNGIITTPVVMENGQTSSYVGDPIKIQVSEGAGTEIFFEDVYIAQNQTSQVANVLTTNKLPVQVYIPSTKYGYTFAGKDYTAEKSIGSYDGHNLITTFNLNATIKYSTEQSTLDSSNTIYTGYFDSQDPSTAGFLKFNTSVGGKAFNAPGYYLVTIYQGNSIKADQNIFQFIFEISQADPDFTVTSLENIELNSNGGVYYTNKEQIRLSWSDPSSKFMSKIDKNQISYQIDGQSKQYINANTIVTNGQNNYVDINLKDINGYYNNANISITMQYEGNADDYNNEHFSATKTVIIDTIAPDANVNKLVSLTGLQSSQLRVVNAKSNTSVSSGLYQYFAFAVDKSNFEQVLDLNSYTNGGSYQMAYRVFEAKDESGKTFNTKYQTTYTQETPISVLESSTAGFTPINSETLTTLLNTHTNKYIEIFEVDLAGNITVYTIYLTDIQTREQNADVAISYIANGETKYLTYSMLEQNKNLFEKSSLTFNEINLFDYAWQRVTIGNSTYQKTPYSNGKYYDLASYNVLRPAESLIELSDFGSLTANTSIQNVKFDMVPYYNNISLNLSILNTSLSVFHTSTSNTYASQEGILIKIPTSSANESAIIYATYLKIEQYLKTDSAYYPETIYESDSNIFQSANQSLPSTSGINLTYVNYMGNTYIKVINTSPVSNRFYKYTIIDNFEDKTAITNIYGSEIVENELLSAVPIAVHYENGETYHYSTKQVEFKYNSAKDRIVITASNSVQTKTYDLSSAVDRDTFYNDGFGSVLIPVSNSAIYTVLLNAARMDMSEGILGGQMSYTIKKYEAIETDNLPYDVLNVRIYNIVPEIELLGVENDSQNGLFNKGSMYGNQITINFKQSTGPIPCIVSLLYEDGTIEEISSGKVVSDPAVYQIIISYTKILTKTEYNTNLSFTISDNDEDFYNVVYTLNGENFYAKATGNSFTFSDGTVTRTISTHYIINSADFQIVYNTTQNVTASEPETVTTSGYQTYIYTITNDGSQNLSGVKFFTRTIAITVIPQTNNILTNFSHYNEQGLTESLIDQNKSNVVTFTLTKQQDASSYKKITWTSYYGIPENIITATIYFGDKTTLFTPKVTQNYSSSIITLPTSGTYYLTFKDMAGNVHMFDSLNDTFTIRYIRSVIYYIQGEAPINYSIYDSAVTVSIPSSTLSYYDNNAKPVIHAEYNGEPLNISQTSSYTYKFTKPGLYRIWFSASCQGEEINEETITFLIVNPNETRTLFEFSQYSNYYIKQIVKNKDLEGEVDLTRELSNTNMGELIYVPTLVVDEDGNEEIVSLAYLRSIHLSLYDSHTGVGKWTLTIATNNDFNQEYTFTVWINDVTNENNPLKVSIADNGETTDVIKVTFNTQNMLEFYGECIVRITGAEDFEINNNLLLSGDLSEKYTFSLTADRTYYIQVLSQSGNLLYTYRVTKNAPLNAISIIVIVVSVVAVAGFVVMFVLLRKKMKIR